ncbi:hypothetical protein QJQ45_028457 [Haematococcus lacustris]|nr:hypothetical protein QJQ45_028457 [Haematococcus lacustris]
MAPQIAHECALCRCLRLHHPCAPAALQQPNMDERCRRSQGPEAGSATDAPSAADAPAPSPSLLDLPVSVLYDIASRAVQLGAGGQLSLTCSAFSLANLLHAPGLRIQLDRQRCDQLLTPRFVAALVARTSNVALTLYDEVLDHVMAKLGSCAAVEACKLSGSGAPYSQQPLDCTPGLAQGLLNSFPGLTALSLHSYSVTCSGLSSLLSHPQLALQLQRLDLLYTCILQPKQPGPEAVAPANLFHGLKLKQLSLPIISYEDSGHSETLLPDLQPLAQHLTELSLQGIPIAMPLSVMAALLRPLVQLQVLAADMYDDQAHLFESPLVLCVLDIEINAAFSPEVAAANHNLAHSCKVPIVSKMLELDASCYSMSAVGEAAAVAPAMAPKLDGKLEQVVAMLQSLKGFATDRVDFENWGMASASDITALAPVCQGCTCLKFSNVSSSPSLEFWRQLTQLMPTVQRVKFNSVEDSAMEAMCEPLQLMADQPWARWLDITIVFSHREALPACCHAINSCFNDPNHPARFRVSFERSQGPEAGSAKDTPSAADAPAPAPSLLDLPAPLLEDIASRAVQLGAAAVLACTSSALLLRALLHAPALRISLCHQRCDQLLSARLVAALRTRTRKLALTLQQPEAWPSGKCAEVLAHVLAELGSCSAVEACKLSNSAAPNQRQPLDCTPGLAQGLLNSFPGLTALSLHGYSVTCSGLASLLSHPQLALHLQQLDLTGTAILQSHQPGPEAMALVNMFHGLTLKHLSLTARVLPDMQPLAHHLTELHLQNWELPCLASELCPLTELRRLVMFNKYRLAGLFEVVQALPRLHSLHLPQARVSDQRELAALLAATQLTCVQLESITELASSCAASPCSWQQLELTGDMDCSAAAYLPLHSLTRPLLIKNLRICINDEGSNHLMKAAAHNLTHACKVSVKLAGLMLNLSNHNFTYIELVQLMPTVQQVSFRCTEGAEGEAMCESLQRMAEQPWARWLDITIVTPCHFELPAWWQTGSWSKTGHNGWSMTGRLQVTIR